jgi:hypothetical protein
MARRACVISFVVGLFLTGCGTSYKVVPVSGRVTMDGKGLGHAEVMFIPEPQGDKPSSMALTDDDGHYSMSLNNSKGDGAVVGKHKVVITLGSRRQLPDRYNRHTTLECDVPATGKEDANFELTSKP